MTHVDGVGARWARVLRAAGLHDVGTLAGAGAMRCTGWSLPPAAGSRSPWLPGRAAAPWPWTRSRSRWPGSPCARSCGSLRCARTCAPETALVTCVAVRDAVSTVTAQLDDEVLDLATASLRRSAR